MATPPTRFYKFNYSTMPAVCQVFFLFSLRANCNKRRAGRLDFLNEERIRKEGRKKKEGRRTTRKKRKKRRKEKKKKEPTHPPSGWEKTTHSYNRLNPSPS
jgi:hypothetical protein